MLRRNPLRYFFPEAAGHVELNDLRHKSPLTCKGENRGSKCPLPANSSVARIWLYVAARMLSEKKFSSGLKSRIALLRQIELKCSTARDIFVPERAFTFIEEHSAVVIALVDQLQCRHRA